MCGYDIGDRCTVYWKCTSVWRSVMLSLLLWTDAGRHPNVKLYRCRSAGWNSACGGVRSLWFISLTDVKTDSEQVKRSEQNPVNRTHTHLHNSALQPAGSHAYRCVSAGVSKLLTAAACLLKQLNYALTTRNQLIWAPYATLRFQKSPGQLWKMTKMVGFGHCCTRWVSGSAQIWFAKIN